MDLCKYTRFPEDLRQPKLCIFENDSYLDMTDFQKKIFVSRGNI